jgi:hypothetical protein
LPNEATHITGQLYPGGGKPTTGIRISIFDNPGENQKANFPTNYTNLRARAAQYLWDTYNIKVNEWEGVLYDSPDYDEPMSLSRLFGNSTSDGNRRTTRRKAGNTPKSAKTRRASPKKKAG